MASACALRDGNQLELSVFAEVLKALTGTPADVYGLDVCGGEVVSRLGGVAAELVVEGAERAEVDAVAGKQLLAKASHRVGQDALDGTLREGRVVLGDVLTELVERQLLVNLRCAIGLGVGDVGLLSARLAAGNVDTVVNHNVIFLFFVFDILSFSHFDASNCALRRVAMKNLTGVNF